MSNVKQGQTAQFIAGHPQQGKVVRILGPASIDGYMEPNGRIVRCQMWLIDPPMLGTDDNEYAVAADPHLKPFVEAT